MADARGRTAARAIAICVGIAGLLTALGYVYGAPRRSTNRSRERRYALAVGFRVDAARDRNRDAAPSLRSSQSRDGTVSGWVPHALASADRRIGSALIGILAVHAYQSFGGARLSIAISAGGTTIAIGLIVALAAFRLRHLEDRLALRNRALAATSQGVFIADGDEQSLRSFM